MASMTELWVPLAVAPVTSGSSHWTGHCKELTSWWWCPEHRAQARLAGLSCVQADPKPALGDPCWRWKESVMLAFTPMVDWNPSPGHTLPHKSWLLLECSGNMLASENLSPQLSAKKGTQLGPWSGCLYRKLSPNTDQTLHPFQALGLFLMAFRRSHFKAPFKWERDYYPTAEWTPLSIWYAVGSGQNGVALCGFWPPGIHFLKELFSSFQGCHRKAGIPMSR